MAHTVLKIRDLGAHFPVYANDQTFKPGSRGGGGTTENWKRFQKAVEISDGSGASTTDEVFIMYAQHRMLIVVAYVVPIDGDITLNAATYATWSIINRGILGAGVGVAATLNTSATSLSQYEPSSMTVNNGTAAVIGTRGSVFTVTLAKESSGVATGPCLVCVVAKAIEEHH
ncbi:hypothetical protein LCGC14_1318470 [marine sediment metagenome]|uniref:Uncharacterized protein n=1 Tax=marine sediment metagenome TaxID=412755 RepID=A0A0F9KKR3_9ZZZZ